MSDQKTLTESHFQEYDQMTAEELAAVLRADAASDSASELDSETLLYVINLYAQRRTDRPTKTAREAFADFQRDYLPRAEVSSAWLEEVPVLPKGPSKTRRWLSLVAAAVLILVLGMGTFAHSQLSGGGKPVYRQNRDCLTVSDNFSSRTEPDIPKLAQAWYPQWLPEGYQLLRTSVNADHYNRLYHRSATDEEDNLNISFTALHSGQRMRFYKNPEVAKPFVCQGVSFYLYTNVDQHCAVGCLDGVVISVSGKISEGQILQILASMPLGEA